MSEGDTKEVFRYGPNSLVVTLFVSVALIVGGILCRSPTFALVFGGLAGWMAYAEWRLWKSRSLIIDKDGLHYNRGAGKEPITCSFDDLRRLEYCVGPEKDRTYFRSLQGDISLNGLENSARIFELVKARRPDLFPNPYWP